MIPNNMLCLLISVALSGIALSQTSQVLFMKLDSIRTGSDFERLNKQEQDWNQKSIQRLNESINELKASSFFQDSLSDAEQHDTIQKLRDNAILYAENRSRFVLTEFENQAIKDTISVTKQSKAVCYYSDSTLTILTGSGIFGGIYFTIELQKDSINSQVNFDQYKEKVFKAHLSDTAMAAQIDISSKNQMLYIDHSPGAVDSGQLNGKLLFETSTFYRSANFDPYLSKNKYDPAEVNELYYIGELEFTCKPVDPLKRIDW